MRLKPLAYTSKGIYQFRYKGARRISSVYALVEEVPKLVYSGTLIIGPLLGRAKVGQISKVVTLSGWSRHNYIRKVKWDGQKVVWLVRWSDCQGGHISRFHCIYLVQRGVFTVNYSWTFMLGQLHGVIQGSRSKVIQPPNHQDITSHPTPSMGAHCTPLADIISTLLSFRSETHQSPSFTHDLPKGFMFDHAPDN